MRLWVKLHVVMLDDPKVAAMPDPLFRTFVNLLVVAGRVDQNGKLGTAEEIAYWLRKPLPEVENHIAALEECNVCVTKDGVTRLKNWQKFNRMAKSDKAKSVRERVRKSRENKAKAEKNGESGNGDVTRYKGVSNTYREEKNREEKNREEKINTSAGEKPPASAPPSGQPDPVKALAAVYEQAAGVPITTIPKREQGALYWNPLTQMVKLANGTAADLLRQSVQQLRRGGYNAATPKACLKTFADLYGARQTAPQAGSPTPELNYGNDAR